MREHVDHGKQATSPPRYRFRLATLFSVTAIVGWTTKVTPPTPRHRVMNCVGPIIELGLPLLQWPTL
ncbi:MAG: hypothetical protein ACYC0X_26625 [Pirellulaceae bacterium]